MEYTPELLCEGFVFPETPRWHRGSFYCCSIDEGLIYKIGSNGDKTLIVKVDDMVSGFCFLNDNSDDMVISSIINKKLLQWDGQQLSEYADLSAINCTGINDMVRSYRGDCYVGSVCFPPGEVDLFKPLPGHIIRVDPQGQVTVVDDDVLFTNGFVITPDNRTMIVAATGSQCLYAYDLAADGSISNKRIFATIADLAPDGICLDADGGVWVTSHEHVYRVVEGGLITDHIDMGAYKATACMLGGDDLKTLLITAAQSHERSVINGKQSGRLYTVKVDVPGAGLPSLYSSCTDNQAQTA